MVESIAEKKRPKFFEEGCEHRQKENSLTPLSEEEEKKREKTAASVDCCSGDKQCIPDWADLLRKESMEKPQTFDIENWEKENPLVQREYSFDEKRRLKALVNVEEYYKWEKENRLWEIQNGLVPIMEDWKVENWEKENPLVQREYSFDEKRRLKALVDVEEYDKWEKENRLWEIQNGLIPIVLKVEDWVKENPLVPKEYSFEEKRMLKALVDGEEYDKWEKENRLWEIQNGLVPLAEEEEGDKRGIQYFYDRLQELNSRPKQNFHKMVEELNSRPLTEEEERLKQLYLENRDKARQGLNTVPFDPYGPGWELAYYTAPGNLHQLVKKIAGRPPARAPSRVPLDQRGAVPQRQQGCSTTVSRSPCVISTEEKREKLAAEGRCLIGLYLTPYCKCDLHKCSGGSKFQSDEYPPEKVPIQLAYLRQCRQSHYFDIDDHPGAPVGVVRFGSSVDPLEPFQDFNGNAELLKELANHAIQEYNEKECNVCKYKFLKIEKVNCSLSRYRQYWMTVKVLNLTLGTPIETFQIHAGISFFGDDKKTYCCRLKEEAIVGLPSCEFCFGLLSEGHVTGRKEEALEL